VDLRAAERGDADAIGGLVVRAWHASFRGVVADDAVDAQDPERHAACFRDALPSRHPFTTLVAVEGGAVAGFVHIGAGRDGDTGGLPEVWGCYVDPDHHRRGVGRALMGAAAEVIGPSPATLWTLRDAADTRRFYEALGWRPDGAAKTVPVAGHRLAHVRYRKPAS